VDLCEKLKKKSGGQGRGRGVAHLGRGGRTGPGLLWWGGSDIYAVDVLTAKGRTIRGSSRLYRGGERRLLGQAKGRNKGGTGGKGFGLSTLRCKAQLFKFLLRSEPSHRGRGGSMEKMGGPG